MLLESLSRFCVLYMLTHFFKAIKKGMIAINFLPLY